MEKELTIGPQELQVNELCVMDTKCSSLSLLVSGVHQKVVIDIEIDPSTGHDLNPENAAML
jgi:hypothetical protein